MESKSDRKAAIREFKERKTQQGIFEVRSIPTGKVWVGSSRNLDATKNSIWFTLRLGGHPDRSLQAEWNVHSGQEFFSYEVLEILDDDVSALAAKDLLKEKARDWILKKNALPLL